MTISLLQSYVGTLKRSSLFNGAIYVARVKREKWGACVTFTVGSFSATAGVVKAMVLVCKDH